MCATKNQRFLIKYSDKYLNIKISNLKVFFVETPREAKGYSKTNAFKYLTKLFESDILQDKDINNYKLVTKSQEIYG